jgi:hypothetical protein
MMVLGVLFGCFQNFFLGDIRNIDIIAEPERVNEFGTLAGGI